MWELTFYIICKIYSALCCNQTGCSHSLIWTISDSVNFSTEFKQENKTHRPGSHKLQQHLMHSPGQAALCHSSFMKLLGQTKVTESCLPHYCTHSQTQMSKPETQCGTSSNTMISRRRGMKEKGRGMKVQEGKENREEGRGETYPNNIHLVTASRQYRYA